MCISYWGYFSYFQCKRKSFRAVFNGNIQSALRNNIIHICILWWDDNLSWYDNAMAIFALISWLRNPFNGNRAEVKVNSITGKETALMWLITVLITVIFYFILGYFNTANIVPSTLSVTTSFLAVYLTFRRSPYFAVAYAANDIILIILWSLASLCDIRYVSVVVCFAAFLANDIYGYISWQKMKIRQDELTDWFVLLFYCDFVKLETKKLIVYRHFLSAVFIGGFQNRR